MVQKQNRTYSSTNRNFTGINTWNQPGNLGLGQLTKAENVLIYGNNLVSRPGLQGLLLNAQRHGAGAGSVYLIGTFINPPGTSAGTTVTALIYTYNGLLFKITKTTNNTTGIVTYDNTPTQITGVTGLASSSIYKGERHNKRFYFGDGVNLYSTDGSTARIETGPNSIPVAATVSLTNSTLDTLLSNSQWSIDTLQYNFTDLVIDGAVNTRVRSAKRPIVAGDAGKTITIISGSGFTPATYTISSVTVDNVTPANTYATLSGAVGTVGSTGGTGTLNYAGGNLTQYNRLGNYAFSAFNNAQYGGNTYIPDGWNGIGQDPDLRGAGLPFTVGPPAPSSGIWGYLDNYAEGYTYPQTGAIGNDIIVQDASRYATQFYCAITCWQLDKTSNSSVILRVTGYSDALGTIPIATVSHEFKVPYNSSTATQTFDTVISFASFGTAVQSFSFTVQGGPNQQSTGSNQGLYVTAPVCFPLIAPVTIAQNSTATQMIITEAQTINYTQGFTGASVSNNGTVGYGMGCGALRIRRNYGSDQNWGTVSNIALALSKFNGISGLNLQFAFVQNGTLATQPRFATNIFTISSDSSYATANISTVQNSVLQSFRYLELILGGDFTVPNANGSEIFEFGPLTQAGNLTASSSNTYAQDYSYPFTEINDNISGSHDAALVNVLETNPSPNSSPIIPDTVHAQVKIVIPDRVNSTTTHYAIYRYGGPFNDIPAIARLIAVVPYGSDIAIGADTRNPYYSWNHTTRTLIDNTPDSWILPPGVSPNSGTPLVFGRDGAPSGVTTLVSYHGRLFVAVGSKLYMSWIVDPNAPDVLYWTQGIVTPDDPLIEIKGKYEIVGSAFDSDNIQALTPIYSSIVARKQLSTSIVQGWNSQNFSSQGALKNTGMGCLAPRASCMTVNDEAALVSSGVVLFNLSNVTPASRDIEKLLRPKSWDGSGGGIPANLMQNAAMCMWDRRLFLTCPSAPGSTKNDITYIFDTREDIEYRKLGWVTWTRGFTSIVSMSSASDQEDLFFGGYDGQIYHLSDNYDLPYSDNAVLPIGIPVVIASRGFGQENDQIFWRKDIPDEISIYFDSMPANTSTRVTVINDKGTEMDTTPTPFTFSSRSMQRFMAKGTDGLFLIVKLYMTVSGLMSLTAIGLEASEGQRIG